MLVRKPLYPDMDNVCNNRNVHEYTPYIIGETGNIIDESWWNSLSSDCKELLRQKTNFTLGNVSVPHKFQFDTDEKFLKTVYKIYIDSFDYNVWYQHVRQLENTPKGVILIPISDDIKRMFVKLYEQQQSWGELHDTAFKQLYNKIQSYMNGEEYFIRMSSTSGKNEKSLRSFTRTDDILDHITGMKLFVDQEYKRLDKESYLILIPWNNQIESRHEFRIFVVNNKLTGVSQQNRYDLYQHSTEELEAFESALNNISFLDKCPYATYVADVYVDIQTKRCCLIELNPFGAHSGAGAALFNWMVDYELLHGLTDKPPELRYLSVINY